MKLLGWVLKRKVLMLGLLALILTANAQNVSYIAKHKPVADELASRYGIPSSVFMAVAMVESSSGQCKHAKRLNNHFGIVGKNNLQATTGYKSRYKQYNSEDDSFADFCRVISGKTFYAYLKDKADPKVWIKAISKAGYSEQPAVWEKRILSTISSNKL